MHEPEPRRSEREPRTAPARIYVASLSDYNAGILHGTWLDADTGARGLHAGIADMLATSPSARRWGEPAEEWAIHDYEGFGPVHLSEYESIERVAALARGIARHGEAFAHYWDTFEPDSLDDADLEADFDDRYLGSYETAEDYGRQLLDDLGLDPDDLPGIPETLRSYTHIDVAAWVRDMEHNGEVTIAETNEGVLVFSCL